MKQNASVKKKNEGKTMAGKGRNAAEGDATKRTVAGNAWKRTGMNGSRLDPTFNGSPRVVHVGETIAQKYRTVVEHVLLRAATHPRV